MDIYEIEEPTAPSVDPSPPSDDFDEMEEADEVPLFEDSATSVQSFSSSFELLCQRHRLSDAARKDFRKLFSRVLPIPNNVLADTVVKRMPATTVFECESSKFVCVDIQDQLEQIIKTHRFYFQQSWSGRHNWRIPQITFADRTVYLALNIDGAPLFKSRKLSVWPIWVQCQNLPPVLRSSFKNLALLGLWHGLSKPDWDFVLTKIYF